MLSGADWRQVSWAMAGHGYEGHENHQFMSIVHHAHYLLAEKTMNPWQYSQSAGVFFSPVSSHYAQAYIQNSLGGFPQQTQTQTSPSTSTSAPTFQSRPRPKGTHGCTHDRCTFSGSQKAVEIHMMDRHLIYPPNHKNKQRDWDADPSLKGHVFSVSHAIFHLPSFAATSSNLSPESPSSSREPT